LLDTESMLNSWWNSRGVRLILGNLNRSKFGYSLLEMIVAGMIFAIVSVALAGVFNYHYRAIGSSRLFLVAQHLARSKADEFIAAGHQKIAETVINPNPNNSQSQVTWTIRDQQIKTIYNIDSSYQTDGATNHRICTVRVSWEEGGRTRNVQYTVSISPEN
jgi:type II secretory pathway pseudopilin PulG